MASNPRTVIRRFVFKRTLPGALLWGSIFAFSAYVTSTIFLTSFPTVKDRVTLAVTFSNNAGLQVLLGHPYSLETVGGFTQWRALGAVVLIGAIWAIVTSTKTLRGDEDEGRMELLLVGQTSAGHALLQSVTGMLVAVGSIFVLDTAVMMLASRNPDIAFGWEKSLMLGAACAAVPAMVFSLGALASQIAANRRQAVTLTAGLFGAIFLVRALTATSSDYDWLRPFSPLGWVELLRPLTDPHPLWLLPIAGFIILCTGLAAWLASVRDMGGSFLKDSESAPPRLRLLGTPFDFSLRMALPGQAGWILCCGLVAAALSASAKTAATALSDSQGIQKTLSNLTSTTGAAANYLGVIFLMLMIVLMVMAVGTLTGLREEEASYRLDNLLVRPVSRQAWLASKALIGLAGIALSGVAIGLGSYLSVRSLGLDLGASQMLLAGINTVYPAAFVLGAGILTFGLAPRLVGAVGYGIIAGAFLIELVASALNLGDWVEKLSILHYSALAPAVDPNWGNNAWMLGLGILAAAAGVFAYTKRDSSAE